MWRNLSVSHLFLVYFNSTKQIQHIGVSPYKKIDMGLFSRKSPKEKLQDRYRSLVEESYKLSTVDRKRSDAVRAEAEEILKQLDRM